ncbi:MAG: hypothetical protein NWR72_06070 [Bacteroidia bacterium]|nr:hypothetical protein [Bacteroidia bacterium]
MKAAVNNSSPLMILVIFLSLLFPAPSLAQTLGQWTPLPFSGNPDERHEAAFLQAGEYFYLLGGRTFGDNIERFDPINSVWEDRAPLPQDPNNPAQQLKIHHVQPVVLDGLIYFAGAFTKDYSGEDPIPNIWIYDPLTDVWIQGPEIPLSRQRGSAGAVAYEGKLYLVCGITNGHIDGWVPWLDRWDPATNKWDTLTPAPQARDHFQAVVARDRIYVAGGRRSQVANGVFGNMVAEVDIYEFATNSWRTVVSPSGDLPDPRAGNFAGIWSHPQDGEVLLIGGGEASTRGSAFPEIDALSLTTETWLDGPGSLPSMNQRRHGTGIIVFDSTWYVAAGGGPNRGGNEVPISNPNFMEVWKLGNGGQLTLEPITASELQASWQADTLLRTAQDTGWVADTLWWVCQGGNQAVMVDSLRWEIDDSTLLSASFPYSLPVVVAPGDSIGIAVQWLRRDSSEANMSVEWKTSGLSPLVTGIALYQVLIPVEVDTLPPNAMWEDPGFSVHIESSGMLSELVIISPRACELTLEIYDIAGRCFMRQDVQIRPGEQSFALSAEAKAGSVVVLRLDGSAGSWVRKMIIP